MEHGYYSPESASRGNSSTWWYKPNGEAVEVHLVAEPEWAERNFKWKDRIDLGPVAKWAFHQKPKPKEKTMENLNCYGVASFLDVKLPPGEKMLDVRPPRKGERWLDSNGLLVHGEDGYLPERSFILDLTRIILAPKKVVSEEEKEYGYQPVVPDGYERIKFDYLNTGDTYIAKNSDAKSSVLDTLSDSQYNFWAKVCKRVIVRKKKKRFAVARVELPEGCETKDKLGYIWIKRNGSQYSEAIETSYQVVEE